MSLLFVALVLIAVAEIFPSRSRSRGRAVARRVAMAIHVSLDRLLSCAA
jgi:hypothetical protein